MGTVFATIVQKLERRPEIIAEMDKVTNTGRVVARDVVIVANTNSFVVRVVENYIFEQRQ
jgi:hypothetical protein